MRMGFRREDRAVVGCIERDGAWVVPGTWPPMGWEAMRGAQGDKGGEDVSRASQTELKAPWPSARTKTRVGR